MTFSDKIKRSREVAGMTQQQLADEVGVSKRTIASYESDGAKARRATIEKLAAALKVSVKYLSNDDCLDPLEDIEKDEYIEQARALYGAKGVRDMNELLADNAALFAGGELSQELMLLLRKKQRKSLVANIKMRLESVLWDICYDRINIGRSLKIGFLEVKSHEKRWKNSTAMLLFAV